MTRFKRRAKFDIIEHDGTTGYARGDHRSVFCYWAFGSNMADLFGWPKERHKLTVWIAHLTFCAAYVAGCVVKIARAGHVHRRSGNGL